PSMKPCNHKFTVNELQVHCERTRLKAGRLTNADALCPRLSPAAHLLAECVFFSSPLLYSWNPRPAAAVFAPPCQSVLSESWPFCLAAADPSARRPSVRRASSPLLLLSSAHFPQSNSREGNQSTSLHLSTISSHR